MADPITDYYADNPWQVIDKNQRQWYDPDLIAMWRQKSVFSPTISFAKNLMGDIRTSKMTVTGLLDPHPDFTALTSRQLWMNAMHIDSRSIDITFQRYGGKVAYHKYDDMVSYWKQNGQQGLRAIMNGALGNHQVDVLDMLARNAYITGAFNSGFNMYTSGSATSFNGLLPADKFDLDISMDIWLGMANRNVAAALGANGAADSIICFTTPGVIYDIQHDPNWISVRQYQDLASILRYEVGAYKNVRFVQTPKCTLWNCGAIAVRYPISAAITAGDGAPDPSTTKVDGTYAVGQTGTGGITRYVQLGSATSGSMSDFKVNDIVTFHKTVTNAYGVTNGVDYNEGSAVNRRIVGIDVGNRRLVLDQPILVDFVTDLGGSVYGYVTKGRHIHASIFVGGPQGIVAGSAQAPMFHTPPPIDDFESIYRFSWDAFMGYQTYAPEVFEVVFSAGSTRIKGATTVQ
jgi:hypothetical protein